MKSTVKFLTVLCLVPFLSSCGPAFLKKLIKDNPEIITESIKSNPEKYIEALTEAQQSYIQAQRAKEEEKAKTAMEEEFKNPKKPDTPDTRVYFGKKEAPVTIVEYSDFQCGFCGRASYTLKRILKAYPDQVRVLYKHLPLPNHPQAFPAAKYYEAIGRQDPEKARKFHDALFANQGKVGEGEKYFEKLSQDLGINMKKLKASLKNAEEVVRADEAEARKFGFNGTPAFLVGGVTVSGARGFDHFKRIIDRHIGSQNGGGGEKASPQKEEQK